MKFLNAFCFIFSIFTCPVWAEEVYMLSSPNEQPTEIKDSAIIADIKPFMSEVPSFVSKLVQCATAYAQKQPKVESLSKEDMELVQLQCGCDAGKSMPEFMAKEQSILAKYPNLNGKKVGYENLDSKSGYSFVFGNNICQMAKDFEIKLPALKETAKKEQESMMKSNQPLIDIVNSYMNYQNLGQCQQAYDLTSKEYKGYIDFKSFEEECHERKDFKVTVSSIAHIEDEEYQIQYKVVDGTRSGNIDISLVKEEGVARIAGELITWIDIK